LKSYLDSTPKEFMNDFLKLPHSSRLSD